MARSIIFITSFGIQRSACHFITLPRMSDLHSAAFSTIHSSRGKSQTLNCVISPLQDWRGLKPPPILSWSWPRYVTPPDLETDLEENQTLILMLPDNCNRVISREGSTGNLDPVNIKLVQVLEPVISDASIS